MANNLWASAVASGTLALRPSVPDVPLGTFAFYFATDTGQMYRGNSAGAWVADDTFSVQGTPTAKTADATLTIAELLTRIITATSASAVALTLPTGTLTDAGIGTQPIGSSFEWGVINLGSASGAVTMTAGTDHTYVGSATVAIATSARFRTRKTAANTFVTYRIS